VSTLAPPPSETSTLPELEAVRAKFPAGSVLPQDGLDQPTWIVSRDVLATVARELKENPATRFDLMLDLCGVDFPDREERFEAVYHLYSMPRLRTGIALPAGRGSATFRDTVAGTPPSTLVAHADFERHAAIVTPRNPCTSTRL
jgi:hypothetical protein